MKPIAIIFGGITMRKYGLLLFTLLLIFTTSSVTNAEKTFGPDEWEQYRMNSDKNAVYENGSDALDAKTFKTANEVRSTPVIVGDRLFIGNHDSGELFAFDVNTGEKIWEEQAPNWIHSEMIYHDEKVFVGFGNRFFQDNGIRGTEESGVLALDAESGQKLWKYNTEGEVMPTPAYYDGHIYITTGDRHLYKLDPDSGDLKHKEPLEGIASMSSPNITEDTLFVGGSTPFPYTFTAYDLAEDDIAWQKDFPDVIAGLDDVPPAVADDIVVTTAVEGETTDPEHFMYAMDINSGELLWKESLGKGEFVENNKSGAPMIYEGNIYVGSPITKTFYAYDLQTGEQLWKFENEIMKAPPVAQDDIVYFTNTKGYVYALDADDGNVLGKKELNKRDASATPFNQENANSSAPLSPAGPVIMNDTMFVGSQDSYVYSFPLKDITASEESDDGKLKQDKKQINNIRWIVGISLILIIVIGWYSIRKLNKHNK